MQSNSISKHIEIAVPAKINLFLKIIERLENGYHSIDSIFQSISLYDRINLYINSEPSINITVNNKSKYKNIPVNPEKNICGKIAGLFLETAKISKGVIIDIEKNIPVGAGLGGGSSDAAGVLIGLEKIFDVQIDENKKQEIALQTGADVPFCLTPGAAIVRGIGEQIHYYFNIEHLKKLSYIIIKPDVESSTENVYKNIKINLTDKNYESKIILEILNNNKFFEFENKLFNDLYESASDLYYKIKVAAEYLNKNLNKKVNLSGSGSVLFMVYDNMNERASDFEKLIKLKPDFEFIMVDPVFDKLG